MTIKDLSDDQLNLFIDEELDTDELNEIRQAVMEDMTGIESRSSRSGFQTPPARSCFLGMPK